MSEDLEYILEDVEELESCCNHYLQIDDIQFNYESSNCVNNLLMVANVQKIMIGEDNTPRIHKFTFEVSEKESRRIADYFNQFIVNCSNRDNEDDPENEVS